MTTARQRKTVTAKLTPGKDADLIGWFDSLPEGQRNQAVKDALRAGIFGSHYEPPPPVNHPGNAAELERLRQQVNELSEALANDLPDFVRGMVNEQLAAYPFAPVESSVEPAGELNAAELEQRTAKLKTAKW